MSGWMIGKLMQRKEEGEAAPSYSHLGSLRCSATDASFSKLRPLTSPKVCILVGCNAEYKSAKSFPKVNRWRSPVPLPCQDRQYKSYIWKRQGHSSHTIWWQRKGDTRMSNFGRCIFRRCILMQRLFEAIPRHGTMENSLDWWKGTTASMMT